MVFDSMFYVYVRTCLTIRTYMHVLVSWLREDQKNNCAYIRKPCSTGQ